ncbi:MAG: murein biosynthesis integral membrane protein MurJ [Chloroflexi bacterium]|nr:murein biosynthesis integral membrane protein MurJ [Chloroflexota bacterium]MCC6893214.1 murein biosynthesis integral membrane protein MurJ [Anaerolineae bacterium]
MSLENPTTDVQSNVLLPDEVPIPTQEETNAGVARASSIIAMGNLAGRVLGLVREIALTNLFGASRAVDAFKVATSVPTGFYDLLIGGHVNSAIIPVLSEITTREGQKALWGVISVLLSLVTAVLALLILLVTVLAPQVIGIVGSGFDPEKAALSTHLLQLIAPSLLFMSLFAVISGALYALREFKWTAFSGVVFNGSIVLATILLAPPLQLLPVVKATGVQWTMTRPAYGISAAAIGWLIGSLAQLAIQVPGMKGARLRLNFNWRHPAVRQIAKLYAPVMFSLIMDILLIRPFSFSLASQTGDGSIGYMNWATTLIQFPQGLVATAISIAILPTLARQAAIITEESSRAFKDTLGLGLRLATTLIIPATIGLLVLANPIIALLFQHGAFMEKDTIITAMTLRLYLIGLPFACLDLLLVYAFYARQDTLTPALIGAGSLAVYAVTAIVLFPRFGLFSLMLADSLKHVTHALVSAVLLSRRMNGFGDQRLVQTVVKTGLAAGVMGLAAGLILPILTARIGTATLVREALLVGITGGISVAVFLGIAALLKIEELRWIGGLLARRLGLRS